MNRLGLVDFWFYDYQEFNFKDGHMMLRGGNGSGKSVTMQSFLPLILDGNKNNSRLDPFGSRDRKIENYLLDEEGVRDNRIAYLFLEFKRKDLDVYKTIGLGMHAKRNSKLNTWYFVIEDNQRIGKDIHLYQRNLGISKQSLKNLIGDQLIETQGEYTVRVNQALFGFETVQEYKDVLDLMIQLRSPKLSNSLKPVTLNEILNDSLRPLSDDDLRPMTEAITSMDATKDQMLVLEENVKASQKILDVYDQYNHRVLLDKIENYQKELKESKSLTKKSNQNLDEIKQVEAELRSLELENEKLQTDMDKLLVEKNSLAESDLEVLVNQLQSNKESIVLENQRINDKHAQLELKSHLRLTAESHELEKKDQVDLGEKKIHSLFNELEELQKQLQFEEHIAIKNELLRNLHTSYNASYSYKRINEETAVLNDGLSIFETISQLEQEHNTYTEILETEQYALETIEIKISKKEVDLKSQIEASILSYHQWNHANTILKLDAPLIDDISFEIEKYDSANPSPVIQKILFDTYTRENTRLIKSEEAYVQSLEFEKESLNNLKEELHFWKETQEPKLPLDDYSLNNRKMLHEAKIDYKVLYELLEFEDYISDSIKGQVEEKLRRSNLLGALIINKRDLKYISDNNHHTADHYIISNQDPHTLKPYFLSHEFLQQDNWQDLFLAFGIEDMVYENHNAHLVKYNLYSVVSTQEPSRFIGKQSRQKYRQEKIELIEHEIKSVEEAISLSFENIKLVKQNLSTLSDEYDNYPKLDNIASIQSEINYLELIQIEKVKQIQILETRLKEILVSTHEDRVTVSEMAHKLGISSTKQSFDLRKNYLSDYRMTLQDLMSLHEVYLKDLEMQLKLSHDRQLHEEDIEVLRDEISFYERTLNRLTASVEVIEKQLEEKGYQDIKARLEMIHQLLQEKGIIEKENIRKMGSLSARIDELNRIKDDLLVQCESHQNTFESVKNRYEAERDLAYVTQIDDIKTIIQEITNLYPELKSASQLSFDLQDVIHHNRAGLQDYNITRFNIFEDDEEAKRLDISARYAGENINIKTLNDYLVSAIEDQKLLLEEKDRELIEEILINTISKKIRNRIHDSKSWVTRINRYMDGMNTSSGLKLSLNWQSKAGETEDELNSEKLVSLMERDVRLLRDEDKQALSKHFESKINLARKRAELEETFESFHQIMSQIMDFRSWFTFKIMVQKQGERKKELTNNIFNTYSGGEKAMSMYIPLFSALAAKYEGGRKDAPHIIALDEAFAGVDENNIENMFELIRNFKFDYIMNSQVLWGDYPSVPSLAIYELFRPENAPFVTVVSYEWNGSIKRMVM